MVRERSYRVENIKIILMFCVIFGHLLESIWGGYNVYKIIYSFHMPVFLLINGWCAPRGCATKRALVKLIYPYMLFQVLYQLFNTYVINEGSDAFHVQFGTPYWLLWYLLSLLFYYLLIPLIATADKKYAIAVLFGTVILAVCAGFDNSIGYYMSLSRTFVFFPFFVLGYYMRHPVFETCGLVQKICESKSIKLLSIMIAIIICRALWKQDLNGGALYGSLPYTQGEFPWFVRLELIAIAFMWCGIFMLLIPNRKIIGRIDTFPIYVMHGFVVLYLRKDNPFTYSLSVNLLIASIICIVVMLVFGNKYMSDIVRFLFRGDWIEWVWNGGRMRGGIAGRR